MSSPWLGSRIDNFKAPALQRFHVLTRPRSVFFPFSTLHIPHSPLRISLVSSAVKTQELASKDHDSGYRCWPNFLRPAWAGCLSMFPRENTGGDKADQWFGGLDDNRLEWAEGRDFDFEPRSQVRPDLVIRGWVEVDGRPHSGIVRVVNFRKLEQAPR